MSKYILFTYVDRVTGKPISAEPARNGMVFPSIDGLQFSWSNESAYPTAVPRLYGMCPDDAITNIPGVICEMPETDWHALWQAELDARVQKQRAQAKADRQRSVDAITVTTASGKVFDGDETSQGRMARAILALDRAGVTETTWVLADNTPALVTVAELTEALVLSGAEQTRLWVIEQQGGV